MLDTEPFYVVTLVTDYHGGWTMFGRHLNGARRLVQYLKTSFPNETIIALCSEESEEAWREKLRRSSFYPAGSTRPSS